MTEPQQETIVPTEAVLAIVEAQRNAALTESAQMRALAQQFMAERDQERAENARLRGDTATVPGQVADAG